MSKGSWRRPAAIPRHEVEKKFDELFPPKPLPHGSIPLPEGEVRYNGGVRCSVLRGPCSCGAWHGGEETLAPEGTHTEG